MTLVAPILAGQEEDAAHTMTPKRVCPFCGGEGKRVPVSRDELARRDCVFCRGKGLVRW